MPHVAFTLLCLTSLLLPPALGRAADGEPLRVRIGWNRAAAMFRPLHGINKGPLAPGGLIDLRPAHRALAIPFVRLHDCHWPNPDVVDIHVVFPNPDADPTRPESYDFKRTDAYLRAIRETGAQIIYRLGESIEHGEDRRFAHPPKDPAKWAEVCLGIIRHYNDHWAEGVGYGIRYWEIWNEPENRPAMWSGSDDDYFRLYRTSARRIKETYPHVAVGGPGAGHLGTFENGELVPSPFMARFLELCRSENLPLDFFSWHFYGDNPAELFIRTLAVRRWLDRHGFTRTENHLNEWNYLPRNDWAPLGRAAEPRARRAHYQEIAGAQGAAFIVASLLALQDAPIDICNLFHGELGGFGFFDEFGVPTKSYEGVSAFARLLKTPHRRPVDFDGELKTSLVCAAGIDETGTTIQMLAANCGPTPIMLRIETRDFPWTGPVAVELRRVTQKDSFDRAEEHAFSSAEDLPTFEAASASVTFLSLRKP